MLRNPRAARDRAINALASLIGDNGVERCFAIASRALVLPGNLVVVAGDESRALDPFALKPFAAKHGVSVIATWTDRMLSGHAFEIDVVLNDAGTFDQHQALRLWIMPGRGSWLVARDGEARAIAVDDAGIRVAVRQPHRDRADLLLGIAAGQALLQSLVFGGSPYATPLPENLGR